MTSESPRPVEVPADYLMEEWSPSTGVALLMNVLAVILTFVAFIGLLLFHDTVLSSQGIFESAPGDVQHGTGGEVTVSMDLVSLLIGILAITGVLVLHEAVHGVMFRLFGGRPTFGAALVARVLPVLYCTAHGYVFSRIQFTAIGLAPAVVITLAGLALITWTDYGFVAILATSLNFGGAIGDFWMVGLLWRKPAGTLIEDRKAGLRFYMPPS